MLLVTELSLIGPVMLKLAIINKHFYPSGCIISGSQLVVHDLKMTCVEGKNNAKIK